MDHFIIHFIACQFIKSWFPLEDVFFHSQAPKFPAVHDGICCDEMRGTWPMSTNTTTHVNSGWSEHTKTLNQPVDEQFPPYQRMSWKGLFIWGNPFDLSPIHHTSTVPRCIQVNIMEYHTFLIVQAIGCSKPSAAAFSWVILASTQMGFPCSPSQRSRAARMRQTWFRLCALSS